MQFVRVMLVDDNDGFLHMLARGVRAAGRAHEIPIEVVLASSYEQAREMRGFDVAAIDERLAGKSGLDLIASFRSTPRHRTTPFVLMSGEMLDPLTHRAHQLDARPLAKLPAPCLVGGILRLARDSAATPRTAEEERLRMAKQLADEADLSQAEREVLEAVARGDPYDEIARARGTTRTTVETQAKKIREALRRIDVPIFETLRSTLDAAVIEARYDR